VHTVIVTSSGLALLAPWLLGAAANMGFGVSRAGSS
jgi:hypothetical protein